MHTHSIPTQARVVIIGGGIVGASVAYHLTKSGWTDVLLLEQGRLSGGTTWHSIFCFIMRYPSIASAAMAATSALLNSRKA